MYYNIITVTRLYSKYSANSREKAKWRLLFADRLQEFFHCTFQHAFLQKLSIHSIFNARMAVTFHIVRHQLMHIRYSHAL